MALLHAWKYTDTIFKADEFLEATGNTYRLISQSPYTDKKGENGIGVNLQLQIIHDKTDYGMDSTTGRKRDTNKYNSFRVTILNQKHSIPVNQGSYVRLLDYREDVSYVIGFDQILRFGGVEQVKMKNVQE